VVYFAVTHSVSSSHTKVVSKMASTMPDEDLVVLWTVENFSTVCKLSYTFYVHRKINFIVFKHFDTFPDF